MPKSNWGAAVAASVCLASLVGGQAAAALLIDHGAAGAPNVFMTQSGPRLGLYSSQYEFQEFLVRADLAQDAIVEGMTIYTGLGLAPVGTEVILRVFGDANGAVGEEVARRVGSIDENSDTAWDFPSNPSWDIHTAHGAFTGINLAAGTYWFSMSGGGGPGTGYLGPGIGWNGPDIGWATFVEDGAPKIRYDQAFISHALDVPGERVFIDHTSSYRLPFLIDGQVAAIPEPSTWGLLLAGFALAGAGLRQQRRVRVV